MREIIEKIKGLMIPNMGETDRKIRLVVGVILMLLYLGNYVGMWGAVASVLLLLSAMKRVCFVYNICRVNSLNNKISKN